MAPEQRIPGLSANQWDPGLRPILERGDIEGERLGDLNIFRTLAHNPDLLRSFMRFGGELLFNGKLGARERELLILRTAHNCGSPYEWAQHVRIALKVGVTEQEVAMVPLELATSDWTVEDRALLRAADELSEDAAISDATWGELAGRFSDGEMIELVMLVGQYHLVAFLLNSLRVQIDPGFERYAAAGGGPNPGAG